MNRPIKTIRSRQCLVIFFFTLCLSVMFVILSLIATEWQYALLALILCVCSCLPFYVLFASPKLEVHQEYLRVVGPVRELRLPFDDIEEVLAAPMLTLKLKSGKVISCWGIIKRGRLLESEIQEARLSGEWSEIIPVSQSGQTYSSEIHPNLRAGTIRLDDEKEREKGQYGGGHECNEHNAPEKDPLQKNPLQLSISHSEIPRGCTSAISSPKMGTEMGAEIDTRLISRSYNTLNIALLIVSCSLLFVSYFTLYYFQ